MSIVHRYSNYCTRILREKVLCSLQAKHPRGYNNAARLCWEFLLGFFHFHDWFCGLVCPEIVEITLDVLCGKNN